MDSSNPLLRLLRSGGGNSSSHPQPIVDNKKSQQSPPSPLEASSDLTNSPYDLVYPQQSQTSEFPLPMNRNGTSFVSPSLTSVTASSSSMGVSALSPSASLLSLLNLGHPTPMSVAKPNAIPQHYEPDVKQESKESHDLHLVTNKNGDASTHYQTPPNTSSPVVSQGSSLSSKPNDKSVPISQYESTASQLAASTSPVSRISTQQRPSPFRHTNPFDLINASISSVPQTHQEVTEKVKSVGKFAETPRLSGPKTDSRLQSSHSLNDRDIQPSSEASVTHSSNLPDSSSTKSSPSVTGLEDTGGIALVSRQTVINVNLPNENHLSQREPKRQLVTLVNTPMKFYPGKICSLSKYVSYSVKSGKIRVIDLTDLSRTLIADNDGEITDINFSDNLGIGLKPEYASKFVKSERQFFSITSDGTCNVWELDENLQSGQGWSYKLLASLSYTGRSGIRHGVWNPYCYGDLYLAIENEIMLTKMDLEAGLCKSEREFRCKIQMDPKSSISSLTTSLDGSVVFVGTSEGSVLVHRAAHMTNSKLTEEKFKHLCTYRFASSGDITNIIMLPQVAEGEEDACLLSRYAIIGSNSNLVIRLFDMIEGRTVQKIQFQGNENDFNRISYHAPTQTLFVSNSKRPSIYAIRLTLPTESVQSYMHDIEEGEAIDQTRIYDVDQKWNVSNGPTARFNCLVEFSLEQPIIDFALSNMAGEIASYIKAGYQTVGKMTPVISMLITQPKSISELIFNADDLSMEFDVLPLDTEPEFVNDVAVQYPKLVSKQGYLDRNIIQNDTKVESNSTKRDVSVDHVWPSSTKNQPKENVNESKQEVMDDSTDFKEQLNDLTIRMEELFKEEADRSIRIIREERMSQQATDTARLDQILKLVSQTLTKNTARVLESNISAQIESKVIPSLSNLITPIVESAISETTSKAVEKHLASQLQQSLKESLRYGLARTFARQDLLQSLGDSVSKSITPMVEQLVSQQINAAMAGLTAKFDTVVSTMNLLSTSLQNQTQAMQQQKPVLLSPATDIVPFHAPVSQSQPANHAKTLSQQVFQSLGPTTAAHPYGHQQYGGAQQQNHLQSQSQPQPHSQRHPQLPRHPLPIPPQSYSQPSSLPPGSFSSIPLISPQPATMQSYGVPPPPSSSMSYVSGYKSVTDIEKSPTQTMIDMYTGSGNYEEAFTKALQLSDTDDNQTLLNLCRRVDYNKVFVPGGLGGMTHTQTRSLLSQPVLLSLVYQLCMKLGEITNFDICMPWMIRAVSFMEPRDPVIAEFAPRIIPLILKICRETYQRFAQEKREPAQLIDLNAMIGLLQGKVDLSY